MKSLFEPVVPESKFHSSFKIVKDSEPHFPTRMALEKAFSTYQDLDGNFVEQFQTTGFDSRIWELYWHAVCRELNYEASDAHSAPDLELRQDEGSDPVFVEAVTTTISSSGPLAGADVAQIEPSSIATHLQLLPIKLGSALFSKLSKRYWELPHVKGNSLVLAVEPFHNAEIHHFSSLPLAEYLYGFKWAVEASSLGSLEVKPVKLENHVFREKTIPSGFFFQPEAENISCVVFSNEGTVAKFQRMGWQAGFRLSNFRLLRVGRRYDWTPGATSEIEFEYDVACPPFSESWPDGLQVLHNPAALHPIPDWFLPEATHIHLDETNIVRTIAPDFSVICSKTVALEYQ